MRNINDCVCDLRTLRDGLLKLERIVRYSIRNTFTWHGPLDFDCFQEANLASFRSELLPFNL